MVIWVLVEVTVMRMTNKFQGMLFDEKTRFVAEVAMTWPAAWLAVRTEIYNRRARELRAIRNVDAQNGRARARQARGLPVLRPAAKAKGKAKAKAKARAQPKAKAKAKAKAMAHVMPVALALNDVGVSSSDDSASD
jgi:hypothetical protein